MEWISIKKDLPEFKETTDVYVNCMCGWEDYVCMDCVFDREGNFYHNQDTSNSSPLPATHWMPVPDPPKKEVKCKNEFDLCDGTLKNCNCHD